MCAFEIHLAHHYPAVDTRAPPPPRTWAAAEGGLTID